jgi:hypothetical protein
MTIYIVMMAISIIIMIIGVVMYIDANSIWDVQTTQITSCLDIPQSSRILVYSEEL